MKLSTLRRRTAGLLIVVLFLLYCESPKNRFESEVPTISMEEGEADELSDETRDFGDILSLNSIVVLTGLPPGTIIRDFDKVICVDGRLVLGDFGSSILFTTTREGRFLDFIGSKGEAPGQYGELTDFCVDQAAKSVLVYSRIDQSISSFSLDGNFLSRDRLGWYAKGFCCTDDSYFIFKGRDPDVENFNVVQFNKDLTPVRRHFEYDRRSDGTMIRFSGGMYQYKDTLFVAHGLEDTVFAVTDEGPKPYIVFDFGSRAVPDEFRKNRRLIMEEFERFKMYSFLRSGFVKVGNRFFYSFTNEGQVTSGIYDVDRDFNLIYARSKSSDLVQNLISYNPIGIMDDRDTSYLVYTIDSELLLEKLSIEELSRDQETNSKLKEAHDIFVQESVLCPLLAIFESQT